LDLFSAINIASVAKVRKFLPQFKELSPIILLRLGVQNLSSITEPADADSRISKHRTYVSDRDPGVCPGARFVQEIEDMEFIMGMPQQTLNITEPLHTLEREALAAVSNSPVLATRDEYSALRAWSTRRC
jgi:hypothetical protein